jgi:hypothetical protein
LRELTLYKLILHFMDQNKENLVLRDAREDFELFYANPVAYQRKVDSVSDLFGLRDSARLRNDYLPTYVVGDLESGQYKYALFSINPGFSKKQNPGEEKLKDETWEKYLFFVHNFFTLYYRNGFRSPYYSRLGKLLGALEGISLEPTTRLSQFFQEHLINLDLIPYHSPTTGFSISGSAQRDYLLNQLNAGIELLKTQNIRLAIFNGKPMYSLLIEQGLLARQGIKPLGPFPINEKVSLYAFELEGIPCVLFDRFISQPAFQITNFHLTETIPSLIRKNVKGFAH